jgi:glucuronoarabinoxylan endo-1,4-beta-xylanase
MKKSISVVFITLVFGVLTHVVPAYSQELLTNPGFEDGLTGWIARGDCTFTVTTSQQHSGSYSGLATDRTDTWHGIRQSMLGQMIQGNTYTISAWLRASRRAPGTVSVEKTDDSGTSYFNIASSTIVSNKWTHLSGEFTVDIVGTCTALDIYFEGPKSGVDLYVDDASVTLVQYPDPNFSDPVASPPDLPTQYATGMVMPSTRYQTLEGFGGSGGWWEDVLVTHPKKTLIYNMLFDELGLDIYRFRNAYGHDTAYLDRTEEIVAAAKMRNPNLMIMVSSWSPPAYLKSNDSVNGGTLKKDAYGQYMYDEFAQWWADSLADFYARDMNPDYVSIQNEPEFEFSYDSCKFASTETNNLAGYAEAFRALYSAVPSARFLVPETTGSDLSIGYINALTETDLSYVYAYAFHLYTNGAGGSYDTGFDEMYPEKPKMMTEYSTDCQTYADAMDLATLMHQGLTQASITAHMYWDLFWVDGLGMLTLSGGTFDANPVYWAFKQYSAFTDPDWQRVEMSTNDSSLKVSAYISPDETQLTLVMVNTDTGNNISLDLSDLGFTPSSGMVYRTSEVERCVTVGDFTNPLLLYANSITTVALTGTLGDGPEPVDMFVYDITMTPYGPVQGTKYYVDATIHVKDVNGVDVSGATVTGNWTGVVSGSTSGTTQGDGTVTFTSAKKRNGGLFGFCVTDVSASGYVYNSALNNETCDEITSP